MIDKIILENFRCFRERQEIKLAPLTFLVGENSTGKTSFLAAYQILHKIIFGAEQINFNEKPFQLGTFSNIAYNNGNKSKKTNEFIVGGKVQCNNVFDKKFQKNIDLNIVFIGKFLNKDEQPTLSRTTIDCSPYKGEIIREDRAKKDSLGVEKYSVIFMTPQKRSSVRLYSRIGGPATASLLHFVLPNFSIEKKTKSTRENKDKIFLEQFDRWISFKKEKLPYAISPIRTEPRRDYDPLVTPQQSGGEHIPAILRLMKRLRLIKWEILKENFKLFGKSSGLFKAIEIKEKGTEADSQFQIEIQINGKNENIVDVGYGVSQILPILVESMRAKRGQTFLLQQPEVHLHPRAQAELATFLGTLAKVENKNFIVETHSDYMLDRICLDIRDKKYGIKPEDVIILYFQREGPEVKIYPIRIDKTGNILDAPEGYRQFFLDEEKRFFRVE